MSKLKTKLRNYQNALQRLKKAIDEFTQEDSSDVVRDGLIQRFEFTYELAWKTTREYLVDQGIVDKNSPKSVLREAFAQQLIEDELVWLEMIDDRNKTTRLYSQEEAVKIAGKIVEKYAGEFDLLLQKLLSEWASQFWSGQQGSAFVSRVSVSPSKGASSADHRSPYSVAFGDRS